jgi:predicted DNA-binding protein
MTNLATMREKQLNIRLSDEESERLEFVAQHHGLNGANLFRMLLKREADVIKAESERNTFAKALLEKGKKGPRR